MRLSDHLTPIFSSFEPSNSAEIEQLESIVGLPMPVDYVAFLQTFGRCMIDGEATVLGHDICTFFGTSGDVGNVTNDYLLHNDYVEQKLVPIADDMFNNRYVLRASTGEIRFIEYSSGTSRLFHIAESFGAFIEQITVVPFPDGA